MLPIEEDLEDLYERAPCGYLSMSPDGTIVRTNETLRSWLRVTREQISGLHFQDLLTIGGRIFHDTHYMPLLAIQGFAREIAFDLWRRDEPPLSTVVTTTAKRDERGAVVLYRSAILEATSRRSYERELLHQRRAAEQQATARSALLAMISHDIRSPLSTIIMAADLLERDHSSAARARYLRLMRNAASNVLGLVNAILEHSKLEAGAASWEPQPTDLRALLGEISSIHSIKAEAKNIELRTLVDDRIPQIMLTDRYKLSQIVANLVSNAIKFTERGHVTLELRAGNIDGHEAEVELRVSDTGVGIAENELASVFDDFKQTSTGRHQGGTGLGLAIARKLTRLAGGNITVESTVGVGTTFTCVLRMPLAPTTPRSDGPIVEER